MQISPFENEYLNSVREQKRILLYFFDFRGKASMPGEEEGVAAQGFEKMRSPFLDKSVRKADFIQL